ncbi:MAG TPA: hypothetical protein VNT60_06050 [Deinococcales bacterium]|nr:hypothetical protein [Deinococcales bacterium]
MPLQLAAGAVTVREARHSPAGDPYLAKIAVTPVLADLEDEDT